MLKSSDEKTESAPKKPKSRATTYLLLILLVLAIVSVGALLAFRRNQTNNATNCIRIQSGENANKCLLNYDLAQSPEEQAKGLSGRASLSDDKGLMFIFVHSGTQCFWMKDMNFPIDIIWMSSNKEVQHIEENVSPSTYPNAFCPKVDAQYVLEVSAGVASKLNISPGQKLLF